MPARSNHANKLDVGSRRARGLGAAVLRCRNYFEWHPLAAGVCLTVATGVLLMALAALLPLVVPSVSGWPILTPQNGFVLALLLMSHRKLWPAIFLGYLVALSQEGRFLHHGTPLGSLEIFGNLAEVAVAAFALPPFRSFKQWLQEPRLLPAFSAYAIILGPLLQSLTVAKSLPGHLAFWSQVGTVWYAESLGVTLASCLMLVLINRETYITFRPQALPQTLSLLALAGLVTWFGLHSTGPVVGAVAPLVVLSVIVFRLGLRASVIATTLIAAVTFAFCHNVPGDISVALATSRTILALAAVVVFPLGVTLANKHFVEDRLSDAQGELDKLKSLDRLTGMPNRRRFDLVLDREWQRATRDPKHIALLMVDVDDFDLFKDHYGPAAGDECLRLVAARMSDQPHRAHDLISRYDGGKFTVLLPGASGEAVERIAEEFRAEIAAQEWPHQRSDFERVTVSVGWAAMIPTPESKPQDLVTAADAALHLARENGKNRVEGINGSMPFSASI